MKKLLNNTAVLLIILAIIIFVLLSCTKDKINYTKAVCKINGEELELKIKDIKKTETGEYKLTDDEDNKWILSDRYCTFTEE